MNFKDVDHVGDQLITIEEFIAPRSDQVAFDENKKREDMTLQNCAVCHINAKNTCSKCRSVYYCSKQHQKQDWKTHKKECAKLANRLNSATAGDEDVGPERRMVEHFAEGKVPFDLSAMLGKMMSAVYPEMSVGDLPDIAGEYFSTSPDDEFDSVERSLIKKDRDAMEGLPIFEATIDKVDVFSEPSLFVKRWGHPTQEKLHFLKQEHERGSVFLGSHEAYSFGEIFQSFSKIYSGRWTHICVNWMYGFESSAELSVSGREPA